MAKNNLTEKDAQAAARKLTAKAEEVRQRLMNRLAASAAADAARAPREAEQMKKAGVPAARVAERERQVGGLAHLAEFTRVGQKLQRDRKRAVDSVVLTGRIVDAKGKSPGEVSIRFTDATGKEVATERITVDEKGDFIAEFDAQKLGTEAITATLVSPTGKPLHEDPIKFQPIAGIVETLIATVKKRK